MKKTINKKTRVCATCRYWNNGRGCPSFEMKPGGIIDIDNNDQQICTKTGFTRMPLVVCPEHQSNY